MIKNTTLSNSGTIRIALTDLGAILLIYLIPSTAHFIPFPIIYAEPMRIVAIAAYFLSKNYLNALLIALSLPIFSLLFSGHPTLYKASLISIELFLNILILHILLFKYKIHTLTAVVIGIVVSKVVYYSLKYFFISISLLQGSLFSIPIYIQLISTAITGLVFYLFLRSNKK
jgi:hypothetical protein